MQFNLKVKVLKKSKDAPYPEHIIVERKSTHEMVHIYFDKGVLEKFTHIVKDPEIKMAWDNQEKKYKVLPPSYIVAQEFSVKDDQATYSKGPKDQNFFAFFDAPPWNSSSIAFKSCPEGFSDFFVETDLKFKCKPNAYIRDDGVADVKMVYPHQQRKIHPLSKLIANDIIKTK